MAYYLGMLIGAIVLTGVLSRVALLAIAKKAAKSDAALMASGVSLMITGVISILSPALGAVNFLFYAVGAGLWLAYDLTKTSK